MKVGLISLGCPRNLVDSEVMLGLLKKNGFKVTQDLPACDAIIINTCSFIKEAREESLELIFQTARLKKEGRLKALVVAGCLPQRYPQELKKALKEADAFVGTADFYKIPHIIKNTARGRGVFEVCPRPSFLADHTYRRDLITPPHFIYLKIAEGCNNRCSYCVIPRIRGPLRSRSMDSLLAEARELCGRCGRVSEINLIGQDITLYGLDLYGKQKLAEFLRKLLRLKLAKWHRLLYTHPEHYTDELISIIRDEPAVCRYLDLPLQHINDRILGAMNRKVTRKEIVNLIERLRKEIPGLAIRTTFIVGFPGETDTDFRELRDFIRQIRFERLGLFEYSREEGTPAYGFKGQVPAKIKKSRFDEIMGLQQEISQGINARYMGRELTVLIDEVAVIAGSPEGPVPAKAGKQFHYSYIGRTEYDAPEVDGSCYVRSKRLHKPGDFVKVRIVDTMEYDLVGKEI